MMRDPRDTAWQQRRAEMTRLAKLEADRAKVCGCDRCDDVGDLMRLAGEIHATKARISELSDAYTDIPVGAY